MGEQRAAPAVLFVYHTYTQQTRKALEAAGEALRARGCEVTWAPIAFTDPRYAARFSQFPMPHPFLEVVGMIPAELRRRPGKIAIPDEVTRGAYDLLVFGSPTWWLSTNVPIRSFLQSATAEKVLDGKPFAAVAVCRRYWKHKLKTIRRLGTKRGGSFVDGIHFRYEGGQVRSLLSLLSYLGSGEYRERYLGVKIPPTNHPRPPAANGQGIRGQTRKPPAGSAEPQRSTRRA
jgi:menaquinone-dependent protoporphyrinogen IX oxidase